MSRRPATRHRGGRPSASRARANQGSRGGKMCAAACDAGSVSADGVACVGCAAGEYQPSAAQSACASASGREILTLLVRPLLKVLDGRTAHLQLGGAQSLREVVRALQPHQLRPCVQPILATLRRHLRTSGSHGGRPALLECSAALLASVPDACGGVNGAIDDLMSAAGQASLSSDWHERLAAVGLLERLVDPRLHLAQLLL